MRGDRGAAALQAVGVILVAVALIGALVAAVSEGRIAGRVAFAACSVTGAACREPQQLTDLNDAAGCAVPASAPAGATRLAYQVDLGDGALVTVEESAGGVFTVITAAGSSMAGDDPVAGTWARAAAASLYTAGSEAELGTILTGLRRQQRQESWFGTGGTPVADAWAAVGEGLFTTSGEPAVPVPSGRFAGSGAGLAPSAHAYELATALGDGGGAVSVGTTQWQGGGSTELLLGGTATGPLSIEIDRDAGGYVTAARTTVPAGSGTEVASLPVSSADSVEAIEDLLTGLGVTSQRRYAHVVSPASTGTPLLASFSAAATRDGYVSRATGARDADAGTPIPLETLGARMAQARKETPAAQHWDGTAWNTWPGCR